METFFFLAQAIYQTEKDYEALDQETKDLCDSHVSEDFCMSTCFDPFSFAQAAAPKPAFYNCSADEDPLCELGPTLDPARKCKKSLRGYVMRYKY